MLGRVGQRGFRFAAHGRLLSREFVRLRRAVTVICRTLTVGEQLARPTQGRRPRIATECASADVNRPGKNAETSQKPRRTRGRFRRAS